MSIRSNGILPDRSGDPENKVMSRYKEIVKIVSTNHSAARYWR